MAKKDRTDEDADPGCGLSWPGASAFWTLPNLEAVAETEIISGADEARAKSLPDYPDTSSEPDQSVAI